MSLVLEALKKQEAGHDPDAAVSLARASLERRRLRLWVGLFAAAMLANAALLLWMFGMPPWVTSGASIPAPASTDTAAPNADTGHTGNGASADYAPASTAMPEREVQVPPAVSSVRPANGNRSSPTPSPGAAPAAAEPPAEVPAGPQRIRLSDLPAAARARFPGIAFSTHIYSDDPAQRAVVANGQRLREGDRIRGLEVVEITETGVVLAFENYLVEVPIAVDWDHL